MSQASKSFTTPIDLDRDTFMRQLISSLGHLNEAILGSDIASGYVMNVGLSMGAAIETQYKRYWEIDRPFTIDEYAHVIVDLKQKIKGNFSLVEKDSDKVVVRTTSCPFDEFVRQSPSLCFMTSSVFGGIAARNFGYAKVILHRRIALGDPGCYVTVFLKKTPEAEQAVGKEYFPDLDQANADIAEQLQLMNNVHRLRQSLVETSSRWEEVVRSAADAIAVMNHDHVVDFANARWRDLLGVEGTELIGARLDQVIHPENREALQQALTNVLKGSRTSGITLRLRHRNEHWRQVLVSAGPIRDDRGSIVAALFIFHDVTEEREVQRLKDEFLSSASHELRTPVTTIRALTDMLLKQIDGGSALEPEQMARRLQTIRQEADRLALLGNDLVDATRLQTGKLTMDKASHDLNEIVAATLERQRGILPAADNHSIRFDATDRPLPVQIERQRIEQVIFNLLDNAVKYSPEGGTVNVVTRIDGEEAVLFVKDEGIGIPRQDVEQLFTPFFRASNISSRNFMGLGLGLYLSWGIVDAHNGKLSVESVENQGTSFSLRLPLDPNRNGES